MYTLMHSYLYIHTLTPSHPYACIHTHILHTHVTHCTPHEHTLQTSVAYEKGEQSLKYLAQSPEHLKCLIMIYCS